MEPKFKSQPAMGGTDDELDLVEQILYMITFERGERNMTTKMLRPGGLLLSAALLVIVFTTGGAVWAQSPTLTVTLAGQSMIRSDIRVTAPEAMSTIASLVKGGDVTFTNLEGTIAEPGQPNQSAPLQGSGFLTPPGALETLQTLGFNLIALSDNHSNDLGVPGIQNTLREVTRLNLAHAGTGNNVEEAVAPGYLKTPKGTVALVAIASGLLRPESRATTTRPGVNELRVEAGNKPNEEDAGRILQSIRSASKQADLVIVYEHNHIFDKPFGTIFREALPDRLAPADWLKKWVHAEIDAGADIIVMHGAPLLHGIEIYKNRPIFYDLGNFFFNAPPTMWTLQEPLTWESVVPTVEFQGKRLQSVRFRPIVLNFLGKGQPDAQDPHANNQYLDTRGLPALAKGEQAGYILQHMVEYSRAFGTTVEVKGDIAEINLKAEAKANRR
jgi:poly-gamma-glutamate capsule biosynthesis protein CapA/YwtB (metallophosphatase superfamily)